MPPALHQFFHLDCLTSYCRCLALLCLLQATAVAHPFHISSAEVEYDAASGRLQVSLKLQANDLEQALSRWSGRRVNIEHPQARTEIVDYLQRHFYLSVAEAAPPSPVAERPSVGQSTNAATSAGEVSTGEVSAGEVSAGQTKQTISSDHSRVQWVGQELKGAWLWLYFELELPDHRELTRLTNTVLFDVNERQINTVTVRHGSLRTTLKLTTVEPSANFEAKWLNRE